MATTRIRYIDAMRGFTMILVVYSHVCGFCFGDRAMGFNNIFFLFRLPCFFFISGWLFETAVSRPFWQIVRKKCMIQIVPTMIFLLLLAPPPSFFSKLGATKGGYWFTFVLFEFFVLYMFSVRVSKKWNTLFALILSLLAFSYDIFYHRLTDSCQSSVWDWFIKLMGFLSFITWRYYIFFYIGTWVRRNFDSFVRWTGRPLVVFFIVVGFSGIAMIPHSNFVLMEFFVFLVGGVLGMTMIFLFFRWLYSFRLLVAGSILFPLEYIGQRTLDVYLLHYFFLPRFLVVYGDQLRTLDSNCLEFLIGILIALLIVAICLLVSRIIRISPFLGHYLFGAKYEKE